MWRREGNFGYSLDKMDKKSMIHSQNYGESQGTIRIQVA